MNTPTATVRTVGTLPPAENSSAEQEDLIFGFTHESIFLGVVIGIILILFTNSTRKTSKKVEPKSKSKGEFFIFDGDGNLVQHFNPNSNRKENRNERR